MEQLKKRDKILKILTISDLVVFIVFCLLAIFLKKAIFAYICAICLVVLVIFTFAIELSYRQIKVYKTINEDSGIDLQHIAEKTNLSTNEIEKHIDYLYNKGLIEKKYINNEIDKVEKTKIQNEQQVKIIERVIEKHVEVEKEISKCRNCGAPLEYTDKIKSCPYCNAKFGRDKK